MRTLDALIMVTCVLLACDDAAGTDAGPRDAHTVDARLDGGPEPNDASHDADSEMDAEGRSDAEAGVDASDAALADGAADASGAMDASASCAEEDPAGTGCRYLYSDGTIAITGIEAAPATVNRCERDPVVVRFTFEPDDPASRRCARDEQVPLEARWRFTIGDGKAPPRSCIDGAAITVGSRLRVRRRDIVSGSCTPVLFAFDSQLVSSCLAQCF